MPSPPTQVSTMTIYVFHKCVLKAMLTVHIYTSSFVGIGFSVCFIQTHFIVNGEMKLSQRLAQISVNMVGTI